MGEIHGRDASVLEDRSKELTMVASYVEEAPFEQFCGDIVMGSETPSIGISNPCVLSHLT